VDVTEFADRWQEWEALVKQPAERTAEAKRRLDCGAAVAEYQTAQLPDGRWAVRFTCRMEFGSGMSVPWRAFPTREDAVDYFRREALGFFEREDRLRKDREKARRTIVGLLRETGLFGFQEPEPEKS
jgi:hypothetical protein